MDVYTAHVRWIDTPEWRRRDSDELARGLYDAVKPQLYAYDRYTDAYMCAPM